MHDRTLLVSPTEPAELRALGTTSGVPEHHGCDVVWTSRHGLIGVQRKELTDLWTSLRDGRLAREVAKMRLLGVRVLLVEGRVRWSPSGRLVTARAPLTRDQLRGLSLSAQRRGVWVVHSDDVLDSADAIRHLRTWAEKSHHTSLDLAAARRPEPTTARSWGTGLLQCFPLVGPIVAGAIYDHFDGVPLRWSVGTGDLAAVKGVGPTRAAALWTALDPSSGRGGQLFEADEVRPPDAGAA